jgi:hypothetical protein
MKKILFIIIGLLAFTALQAQDFGISPKTTYNYYTGTAADTVQGTNSITKVVEVNKPYIYLYNVTVDIDTLAGGGDEAISCILAGSNDNVFYTTITDVTYAATADTTFNYSDVSTGVLWRFLRLTLTGDGSSAYSELQKLDVKIAPKP